MELCLLSPSGSFSGLHLDGMGNKQVWSRHEQLLHPMARHIPQCPSAACQILPHTAPSHPAKPPS